MKSSNIQRPSGIQQIGSNSVKKGNDIKHHNSISVQRQISKSSKHSIKSSKSSDIFVTNTTINDPSSVDVEEFSYHQNQMNEVQFQPGLEMNISAPEVVEIQMGDMKEIPKDEDIMMKTEEGLSEDEYSDSTILQMAQLKNDEGNHLKQFNLSKFNHSQHGNNNDDIALPTKISTCNKYKTTMSSMTSANSGCDV